MPKKRFSQVLAWPVGGVNNNWAYRFQPPGTTPEGQNVRTYEMASGRARGGQRPGLNPLVTAGTTGAIIRDINHVAVSKAQSGVTSASARTVTGAVVDSGGSIYKINFIGDSYDVATNGTGVLDSTVPVIFSTELFGKLYYVDGTNKVTWTPGTNTAATWTLNSGTFPSSGGNLPRLIEMWRSRIVLAGVVGDEQNWFMSALGDPLDFNYGDKNLGVAQAVAGNNADAGESPDIINCMIAVSDDLLIFGCDNSIWQLTGDPAEGGRIDKVSDEVGIAWGRPYCRSPRGEVYFFGSRGGVYRMQVTDSSVLSLPEKITAQRIDEDLATVNLDTHIVRMAWDERQQGFYLFITALDGSASEHWFYDARNDAFWKDVFADNDHNPVCCHVFDGDDPDDRVVVIGSRNKLTYKIDVDATDDAGVAIDSFCRLGPLRHPDPLQAAMLMELQCRLATGSSDVAYSLFTGDSDEDAATNTTALFTGNWSAGRNTAERQKAVAQSMYLRLRNNTVSETWALEYVEAMLREVGRQRQRMF